MRFVRFTIVAAAFAALALASVSPANAFVRDPRAAAAGRQKIRQELTAAMAKGRLSHMDQYQLLMHAQQILTQEDFEGFQRTLDRVSTQQGSYRKAAAPHRSGDYAPANENETPSDNPGTVRSKDPGAIRRSDYEETDVSKASRTTSAELVPTPDAGQSGERSTAHIAGASVQPPCEPGDPDACCEDCVECCRPCRHWINLDVFSGVEGFKGPIDVGNANGNFGGRVGLNSAVPLAQRMGIGLQAGLAADFSNLEGSPYPFPNATTRDQIFLTVGMFQRIFRCDGSGFAWGFAYDFDFDNYYTDFRFGQWRVRGEYDFSCCDAFGVEATMPERGSIGVLPTFLAADQEFPFRPISQGSMFWTHTFCNDASVTGRFGVAERPNNFVFGADSRVPVTQNIALTSTFTYIMPNMGAGPTGQTQEMWNVGVGLEFSLGGFGRCCADRFRPYIPVADNGSMAVRQLQ